MSGTPARPTLPFHVEAQLKHDLRDVRSLAEAKGLQHAFELELFSAGRAVDEALRVRTAEAGRKAQQQLLELLRALKAARAKTGGGSLLR